MRRLMLLFVPLTLLLAGCFQVESSYVVNEDGSGSQTIRFAFPPEIVDLMGAEAPSLADLENDPAMVEMQEALGDRGDISFFANDDEGMGFTMTVNVPASEDFSAALQEALADLEGTEGTAELPIGDLVSEAFPTITRDGDTWTFSLDQPSLTGEDMADLTGDPESAQMAEMFLGQSTITTRVKLPGEVTEHNADSVEEDGTLVWTQTGDDTGRTLAATSSVGGDFPTRIVLIVAGIVAAAAVIGVVAFLATRDRKGTPPPPAAEA